VVTDTTTNTDRTDYNTLRRSLARSVKKIANIAIANRNLSDIQV